MRWPWSKKKKVPEPLPLPAEIPPEKRVSTPGTRWCAGRPIPAESLDRPRGHEWAILVAQMLASDPKLADAALQLQNQMLAAAWYVVPGGDSPIAQRNADFVREALGLDGRAGHLREGTWEDQVRKLVRYPLLGFQVVEEVWYVDQTTGAVWLSELGDIDPASIWKWVRDPQDGELLGLEQRIDWSSAVAQHPDRVLPARKALIVTHRKVGDDVEGCGLLSPCLPWWRLKMTLIDALGDGVAQWASPIPVMRVDRRSLEESGYSITEQEPLLQTAREFGDAFSNGSARYLVAPAGIDPEIYGGGAYDPTALCSAIDHCNREMASAFIANFAEMGATDVGARSIGEIHWDAYKASIANYLDVIASQLSGPSRPGGGTISRMLQLQPGWYPEGEPPFEELPRLQHRGVEVDGLRDALGVLPALVAGGIVTPDQELEARVRRLLGLRAAAPERPWQERLAEVGSVRDDIPRGQGGRPSNETITEEPK